jgi:hypothetical protein
METLYSTIYGPPYENEKEKKGGNSTEQTIRGGFKPIIEEIIGGGKHTERLKNKAIPFGLAMKREKSKNNYECKNGNIVDNDIFEKLFTAVAKVEKRETTGFQKHNKTKRIVKTK